MAVRKGEFTDRERLFIDEYLLDLNKKQAAIRAGYRGKNPEVEGCRLYQRPAINAAINLKLAERSRRTGISADRVLEEIANIAFGSILDVLQVQGNDVRIRADIDPWAAKTIASIKTKDGEKFTEVNVEMHNKMQALQLLTRHLGIDVKKDDGKGDFTPVIELLQKLNQFKPNNDS